MCKAAVEVVRETPCHKKPRSTAETSKSVPVPAATKNAAARVRNSHSAIGACVGFALSGVDMLRLFVTATLLVLVCSLVGHSSSGWIGFLIEAGPLIAEDLGALALIFLLCLIASQFQCRMQASSSRNTGAKIDDQDEQFGMEGGGSLRQRQASSARKAYRRRTLQHALGQLSNVVRSVCAEDASEATKQSLPCYDAKISGAPCGIYNFHTKSSRNLLLPVEVAACQYSPDVSEHLRQLLEDRWSVAVARGVSVALASIPE